jgi:hypothetical protein
MTDPTALGPCEEVLRLLETFEGLGRMDVAVAIEQAGGDAECVSPDYPPDPADQAVELADPVLVAEVNATLGFLAEHAPGVALAVGRLRQLGGRLDQTVVATFGADADGAIYDGLRVARRIEAARALAGQVVDCHPDNLGEPRLPRLPQ